MNVKREDLIKYGTILIIVFFFFEFFWPALYSPSQGGPQPTATPSPEAQAFQGSGFANATLAGYGLKLLAQCSPGADVIGGINNVSGVAGVLAITRDIYLVDISFVRDQMNTTEDVRGVLERSCIGNFTLLREANLKFSRQVDFLSQDGNQSTTISARDLENAIGYVDPRLAAGASVDVFLIADFLADGTVANLKIQQVDLGALQAAVESEANATAANSSAETAGGIANSTAGNGTTN